MSVTYKAGSYTVATCSGDLGYTTPEGFRIEEEETLEPVHVDQLGPATKADAVKMGKTVKVTFTLSQWGTESLSAVFPEGQGALSAPGSLIVGGSQYLKLTLTPSSDGNGTDIYTFKRAYPSGPKPFNLQSAPRLLGPITFDAYVYTSGTTNRFYTTSAFTS